MEAGRRYQCQDFHRDKCEDDDEQDIVVVHVPAKFFVINDEPPHSVRPIVNS
jgi:hypothetical protein